MCYLYGLPISNEICDRDKAGPQDSRVTAHRAKSYAERAHVSRRDTNIPRSTLRYRDSTIELSHSRDRRGMHAAFR